MARREDWPERLGAVLCTAMDRPFVWGEWDCVHFIAECIKAMTGRDPIPNARGQYDTEFGAGRQILRFGTDLAATCDAALGPRIHVNFAQRGDLLMHEGNLGICVDHTGAFVTPEGLARLPVQQCTGAWRVG